MNDVKYIVGSSDICNKPLTAFSDSAVAFVSDLSTRLMRHPSLKMFPDIAALAFWCRKGNIEKLKASCPEQNIRLGRGLCFHIAPSNIPVNFAFTYLFGLLSGCANVVRLPSKEFPQAEIIIDVIRNLLEEHPEIKKRTAFVRYPADSDCSAEFSKNADARMIWGGDKTVSSIKALETKPKCIDVCFADRYSICVIDGLAVEKADETVLKKLAEDFYNDTYLMDQNACSSPQIILWKNECENGREKFWAEVYALARKRYSFQAAVCVDKYTKLSQDSIDYFDNIKFASRRENLLYRVELNSLNAQIEEMRGHGGYFYEYSLKDLGELCECVSEKYQTLTYFGINPEELRSMVISNCLRGVDRIVPIGKAMDIGTIWDGYDLIRVLSRIVNFA